MKKLRARYGEGIRFFQCGEYGERLERPHHHVLLFNHSFDDVVPIRRQGSSGRPVLFRSKSLEDLWGHGFAAAGSVSFQSAGYVARYALKKVTGAAASKHYAGRVPEYLTMSRRPGIGHGWISKNLLDVYPSDVMVLDGVKMRPPRYYDDIVGKYDPMLIAGIKVKRAEEQRDNPDLTGARLLVKEVVKQAAIASLKREIENP